MILLGAVVASPARLPASVATLIVGLCGIFHGYAHISEMTPGQSLFSYAAGFVLATAMLHAVGVLVGLTAMRHKSSAWIRFAGAATAMCGSLFAGRL